MLLIFQLCNFDVGDRSLASLGIAVQLPEENGLIRAKFHCAKVAILQTVEDVQSIIRIVRSVTLSAGTRSSGIYS